MLQQETPTGKTDKSRATVTEARSGGAWSLQQALSRLQRVTCEVPALSEHSYNERAQKEMRKQKSTFHISLIHKDFPRDGSR